LLQNESLGDSMSLEISDRKIMCRWCAAINLFRVLGFLPNLLILKTATALIRMKHVQSVFIDTLALFNSGAATWYLRNSNTSGAANFTILYGSACQGWIPLVGDFNRDSIDTELTH
jgi:hypothetical protein